MSSKILVTGADGFMGGYVNAWSEATSLERGERVDLRDAAVLTESINKIQPDAAV